MSTLKVLADECIHKDLILSLRKAHINVKTAADLNIATKTDDEIFKACVKTKRVLLTFDRGFGDIFRFDISKSPGVVIILIAHIQKDEILKIAKSFFSQTKVTDLKGNLAIISKNKIRLIRRLSS